MQREKLPWLVPAPPEFRARLKEPQSSPEETLLHFRRMAAFALDSNQLHSLAKRFEEWRAQYPAACKPLHKITIGLLSNATMKLLEAPLVATGLRYGLDIEMLPVDYDQVMQQAMDATAPMHTADVIVIALDARGIPGLGNEFAEDEAEAFALATQYFTSLRQSLKQHGKAKLVFQSLARTSLTLFGSADLHIKGSRARRIDQFNAWLASQCAAQNDLLLDVAALASSVGLDRWHDEVQWLHAKIPFQPACVPLYADSLARLIAVASGKLRKCLVLDLDNTLWGGVIGDDGLEGIALGQGSATGEAFLAIQRLAMELRGRGIILAICSKNNEEVARKPFQSHPEMVLREEHVAVFIANWRDKATNIEAIAKALNIGVDSLVFLDDNPVERQQVRDVLPMVAVPELPDDPALYPLYLSAGGYFETLSFSSEDKSRAEQYQANAMRELEASAHRNLDEFLASLDMHITFAPFDTLGRARIAQLIARSNQYNLTTKRYGEADVEAFENNAKAHTFQVRLRDKYGDNGMISVVIAVKEGAALVVDTWLMSCRVLNRRVEEAVLDQLVLAARADGAKEIIGHYIPTEKNMLVKDHYAKLGFSLVKEDTNGRQEWTLDVATYVLKNPPMTMAA